MPFRNPTLPGQGVFSNLRYFSLASLAAILVAAVLLTLLYRQVAIGQLINVGEHANLALARTALHTLKPQLVGYLEQVQNLGPGAYQGRLPSDLDLAIQDLMRDTTVVRVKIYGEDGTVVFSTRHSQIGQRRADNPRVASALGGNVASKLIFRDRLNPFDQETEEDNLIQSYIPVRAGSTSPIQGVFEIYTDVNPMVRQIEEAEFLLLGGSIAVLMLLYGRWSPSCAVPGASSSSSRPLSGSEAWPSNCSRAN